MSKHHCHYFGCPKETDPKLLFCLFHWRMVSTKIQREVWDTFREGKKLKKHPTNKWLLATHKAELDVALFENHPLKDRRIESAKKYIEIYSKKVANDP